MVDIISMNSSSSSRGSNSRDGSRQKKIRRVCRTDSVGSTSTTTTNKSNTFQLILSLLMLCLLPHMFTACYLWGTDSGTCIEESLDPIWRTDNMPFCSNIVKYPTCVPEYKTLPPSREFLNGRWSNHSVSRKDRWVEENFNLFVQERIALERNKTLRKMRQNEYGDEGKIQRRFNKRPDCQNAYKNLFCYLNFPRCDVARDLTLPTCRSACENFFKSCAYERGLWRCGKSKYFNGYEAEPPVMGLDGNATYMRDYFPGQPWRQNKYTPGGSEHHICTPAILGSASHTYTIPTTRSIEWYGLFIMIMSVITWIAM